MKIQGPNQYINIYRTNERPVNVNKKSKCKNDQLDISHEAIRLLKSGKNVERSQKVSEIKQLVESGQYKIDYEKTAEKMLKFFQGK